MKVLPLQPLLDYYDKLSEIIDRIYPENIPLEQQVLVNFDYEHPKWVKACFPLIMLFHREKAGKLRKSKNVDIMYQNSFNVMSQVVWTADSFGIYKRKNGHKGFNDIVAAFPAQWQDRNHLYDDFQKPKKFKNFTEFAQLYDPTNIEIKAMCEVFDEHYSCDSQGQLRLL